MRILCSSFIHTWKQFISLNGYLVSQSALCPTINIFLLVLHSSSNSNEIIFFRVIIISTDFSMRKPFCFMFDKTGYHIIPHLIFSSFFPFLFFSILLVFHSFFLFFVCLFQTYFFLYCFHFLFFPLPSSEIFRYWFLGYSFFN